MRTKGLKEDVGCSRISIIRPSFIAPNFFFAPRIFHGIRKTFVVTPNAGIHSCISRHVQGKESFCKTSFNSKETYGTRIKDVYRLGKYDDLDRLYELAHHGDLLPPSMEDIQAWIDRKELSVAFKQNEKHKIFGMMRFYHVNSTTELEKLFYQFGLIAENMFLYKMLDIRFESNGISLDYSMSKKDIRVFMESLHLFYGGSLRLEKSSSSLTSLLHMILFAFSHCNPVIENLLNEERCVLYDDHLYRGASMSFGLLFGTSLHDKVVKRISQLLWSKWLKSRTGRDGEQYTLTFLHNRPDGKLARGNLVVYQMRSRSGEKEKLRSLLSTND